ncbi:hypothetical protein SISSUDRAFT_1130705 [Sistotremastrum suecicum HHB10207 ss-3]|uniref:Uncharacterized protein n=1 Tax=Sistotremastrum suecicum HHB10207 ss-3 TaxID=1314776 RepID=A0A166B5H4_9AGAM|nr:hypothetical protein SISSUDRAFT_1130705 [Sistotremastrum suecicum HHB10207 ss-3]
MVLAFAFLHLPPIYQHLGYLRRPVLLEFYCPSYILSCAKSHFRVDYHLLHHLCDFDSASLKPGVLFLRNGPGSMITDYYMVWIRVQESGHR